MGVIMVAEEFEKVERSIDLVWGG